MIPIQSNPLDVGPLAEQIQLAASELIAQGTPANTVRSYQAALRYWAAWHALRFNQPLSLPVSAAAVVTFVVDHAQRMSSHTLVCELPADVDAELVARGYKARRGPLALSTLLHRLSALSQLHRRQAAPNPCDDPSVRELIARTRRAYANRGVTQNKKPALTREPLQRLLATCDTSLIGIRDRALLLFAVATGGRRRSEVAEATLERLQRVGPAEFIYVLGKSKTNQTAKQDPSAHKPVIGQAAKALEAWLQASGITGGRLFRRVGRGGQIGESLSAVAVRDVVIRRAKLAGLEAPYSAHSLRAGFVTQAGLDNIPLGEAMQLSGHTNANTALGYFRAGNVLTSPAARLFDDVAEQT